MQYQLTIEVQSAADATLLGMAIERAGYRLIAAQIAPEDRPVGRGWAFRSVTVEAVTPTQDAPDGALARA
jgi:hypothetical protein